ncbi:hypothetical protein E4U15_002168 [Claviceps sp. LM218 group G6]|nr:hypothetical protein E4U15_002168 [Claviceps sp. LM218 group G6]
MDRYEQLCLCLAQPSSPPTFRATTTILERTLKMRKQMLPIGDTRELAFPPRRWNGISVWFKNSD